MPSPERQQALFAALEGDRLSLRHKLALAGEVLLAYLAVRRRLARGGLTSVVAAIRPRFERLPPPVIASIRPAWRLGSATARVLRILPTDSGCLMQSLVLSRLLAARGIASTLVIGARSDPDFAAHAWVEIEGRPVLPPRGFEDSRLLEI